MGWLDRVAARFGNEESERSEWQALADAPDTWAALQRGFARLDEPMRQFIGLSPEGNVVVSSRRQHVLLLGPTQVGKTTGTLIPNVLCAPGPVVTTSVKEEIYRATAQSRSRLGRLWHFNIAGDRLLPGCTQLRWSPITAAADWTTAGIIGSAMAGASEVAEGVTNTGYFRLQAGEVISRLLHAAALDGRDMHWVRRGAGGNADVLRQAERILTNSDSRFSQEAGEDLAEISRIESRSRGDIFATAKLALRAYAYPGPLSTTEDPNFDPAAFVAGDLREPGIERFTAEDHQRVERIAQGSLMSVESNVPMGEFDTIYITAGTDLQQLVPTIITGLLAEIRQARYALNEKDKRDNFERRPHTLYALDEMANIAPLRDLPATLSQSAGQGLLVMGVLQDLSQAHAKWDKEGDGFLTLFGDVVLYRGIRHEQTVRHISTLWGKSWVTRETYSDHSGSAANPTIFGGSRVSNYNQGQSVNESEQLLPRMDESEIMDMRLRDEPSQDHRRILVMQATGQRGFAYCAPFYSTSPVMEAVTDSAAFLAANASAFELRTQVELPDMRKLAEPHLREQWFAAVKRLRPVSDFNAALAPWASRAEIFDRCELSEAGLLRRLRLAIWPRTTSLMSVAEIDPGWLSAQLEGLLAPTPLAPPDLLELPPHLQHEPVEALGWWRVEIEKFHMDVALYPIGAANGIGVHYGAFAHLRNVQSVVVLRSNARLALGVAEELGYRLARSSGRPVYPWFGFGDQRLSRYNPDGSTDEVQLARLGDPLHDWTAATATATAGNVR